MILFLFLIELSEKKEKRLLKVTLFWIMIVFMHFLLEMNLKIAIIFFSSESFLSNNILFSFFFLNCSSFWREIMKTFFSSLFFAERSENLKADVIVDLLKTISLTAFEVVMTETSVSF